MGISRNAVKKYCEGASVPWERKEYLRSPSVLTPEVKSFIEGCLAAPGTGTLAESDFLGIAAANKMPDKFARRGLRAVKSARADAPIIEEYSLTLERTVERMEEEPYGLRVNVLADESVLDEKGKIDEGKLQAFLFDRIRSGYYTAGEKVGQARPSGAGLMMR